MKRKSVLLFLAAMVVGAWALATPAQPAKASIGVPVPGALPLLAAGIAGLAGVKRRR